MRGERAFGGRHFQATPRHHPTGNVYVHVPKGESASKTIILLNNLLQCYYTAYAAQVGSIQKCGQTSRNLTSPRGFTLADSVHAIFSIPDDAVLSSAEHL